MDKPYYPYKPIGSINQLAKTLGVRPQLMLEIANRTNESYTEFIINSKHGKQRTVCDPKFELKKLQKKINRNIFESVIYPKYLQGGILDKNNKRDYVNNANIHTNKKTIISLDIRNFFDNIKTNHVFNVFKYFFNFPDDVSEILTKLVTLRNKVPQGACTSTYIANLVFYNSEYKIVSNLRNKGYHYSRLLDDITISSNKHLNYEQVTVIITLFSGMFKKYELRLNNKKTKIENNIHSPNKDHYKVTGLWVGKMQPRIRKKERHDIRHQVYICEQEFLKSNTTTEYHKLWNKTSGLVAKMDRLEHKQSILLRTRLKKIFPTYSEEDIEKITRTITNECKRRKAINYKIGHIKKISYLYYQIGIIGRTNKKTAKALRNKLKNKYKNLPNYSEIWS